VEVPVLGRKIRVAYAYNNGVVHYEKPLRFSQTENSAAAFASFQPQTRQAWLGARISSTG